MVRCQAPGGGTGAKDILGGWGGRGRSFGVTLQSWFLSSRQRLGEAEHMDDQAPNTEEGPLVCEEQERDRSHHLEPLPAASPQPVKQPLALGGVGPGGAGLRPPVPCRGAGGMAETPCQGANNTSPLSAAASLCARVCVGTGWSGSEEFKSFFR